MRGALTQTLIIDEPQTVLLQEALSHIVKYHILSLQLQQKYGHAAHRNNDSSADPENEKRAGIQYPSPKALESIGRLLKQSHSFGDHCLFGLKFVEVDT